MLSLDDELLKSYTKLTDSLKVSVKIDHGEVLKVIVRDLISKRNSPGNKIKGSFDDVLLYYLGEEDFEKYVTNNEPIED